MVCVNLKISGMNCNHCVMAVKSNLLKVPGVKSADVSLSESSAKIEYDEKQAKMEDLISAVEEEGYSARV